MAAVISIVSTERVEVDDDGLIDDADDRVRVFASIDDSEVFVAEREEYAE